VLVEMATGAVPASFTGLKSRDPSLGFTRSMDFVRISDMQKVKAGRRKVSVIRNSNPGTDTAELQTASERSPLLGIVP
jgi:(E)-4-hydroxy-3-methylbut-2-enyl-diphosphate synthase